MIPKSKLQFDVISKSKELQSEKKLILPWAVKDCLLHVGLATKNRVICMDCGGRFSTEIVKNNKAVCPNCGIKLEIEKSQSRTLKQKIHVGYAQIIDEYQVVRYFEINSEHGENQKSNNSCYEILQHWIMDTGKTETVARIHTVNYYCDSWSGGNMEIRKAYHIYGGLNQGKYDVYTESFHPKSEFKPMYEKIGINRNLAGLTFLDAKRIIPNNPQAETLLKARQYDLLSKTSEHSRNIEKYWPSIKICLRNKYTVKDASMWFDYIDLLIYFNRDLRNSFYVCPKNLNQAHDSLVAKKRNIQSREKREKQREMIEREQLKYEKQKANFFGLQFIDGDIQIRTLATVEEFMKEGDELGHCVFTNEYYKKKESLIMSARIQNKPIETIEVNLKKLEVVQVRGKGNLPTEYHYRIVDLVKANLPKIAKQLAV